MFFKKKGFSLRDKFTSLNGKIARKVNSPRKNIGERHVHPLKLMFPKGGHISPRYIMKFTMDNFTSPRGRFFSSKEKIADNFTSSRNLAGERQVSPSKPIFLRGKPSFPREEIVEKGKSVRCIIPLVVSPGQRWHVV